MKTIGTILGVIVIAAIWLVSLVAGLAVPALTFWALGHFAFGWW